MAAQRGKLSQQGQRYSLGCPLALEAEPVKIKSIRLFQHDLPIVGGPYIMSSGPIHALDTALVQIEAENGIIGWGETCPLGTTYAPSHAKGARAALAVLAPGLLGVDLTRPRAFHHRMDSLLEGHAYAKAALDIALFDALGKFFVRPVADLLGGQLTARVPSYYALNVGPADEVSRLAKDRVQAGFGRLQLKVGGRDVREDIEVARSVHAAVGEKAHIVLDANRSLTREQALFLSNGLRDIPLVIEQPCATSEECIQVRPSLNHPMYIDETADNLAGITQMVGNGLVDGFGLKVTRLGGLQPMMAVRDVCEAANLPHTCDDFWGGNIITAACIHLAATVQPKRLAGVWSAQSYIDHHYDPVHGPRVEQGMFSVPDRPGLGLDIDPAQFGKPILELS